MNVDAMSRRYDTLYERLIANSEDPESTNGCWPWKGHIDRYGYGRINVRVDGKHVKKQAHRVMAEVIVGRPLDPELETVEHCCAFKPCINPDHFEFLSRADNSAARWTRGLNR